MAQSRDAPPDGDDVLTRSAARTVVRDALAFAPAYMIPGLASLVSVPVLFGILGADGYGRWAILYGIANGVPQVTTGWLEAVLLRFGHRREQALGPGVYVVAEAASSVLAAGLALAFIPGTRLVDLAAAGILTASAGANVLVAARLQAMLRFGAVSRSAVVRALTGAVASIAAAIITGDAAWSALGLATGYAAGAIAGWRWAARDLAVEDPATRRAVTAAEVRAYGFGSAVFAVGSFVLAVGDRFILSSLRPLADVGIYAATYSIADLVFRLVPSVVVSTIRQRLFRSWDEDRQAERAAAITAGALALGWIMAVGVVLIVSLTQRVHWAPVDPTLIGPIAAGLGVFIVANALVIIYSAQYRQVRVAAHVAIAAGVNVAMNLVLVPGLGALGAAYTTVLSYVVFLALNLGGIRRTLRRPALAAYPVIAALVLTVALASLAARPDGPWLEAMGIAAVALAIAAPFLARLLSGVVARERGRS